MHYPIIITEELLNTYSDLMISQGSIPELLYRLIIASVDNVTGLRIPFGGSINQPGLDAIVDSPIAYEPYIPYGLSVWEISTSVHPQQEATKNFTKRTKNISVIDRKDRTFIAVTSRSGTRYWTEPQQRKWLNTRRGKKGWKDVRIIDGTIFTQWIHLFPEIGLWLAELFHFPVKGLISPTLHWKILEQYGSPPKLTPNTFLVGRDLEKEAVLKVFRGETNQLILETKYPDEGIDFIVAVLASLEKRQKDYFTTHCLIIDNEESWNTMCTLPHPHVLLAKPSLDLNGAGIDLLQHAKLSRHAVIFATMPTGGSHGNSVSLMEIKPYELSKVLEECGYTAERARLISDKCSGKIPILKRILSDLSATPQWASSDVSTELRVASIIGQWNGNFQGDREAIEGLLGKQYGEWIGKLRPTTLQPDPPLIQRDEKWRFISRFEGWECLSPYISNDDLDRFQIQAKIILRDKDPKFELPIDKRLTASIIGKVPKYSETIKMGIAETLALLGSHPESLTSCSHGKPELIAARTVREILSDTDWVNWATLNNVLPLLAESAPEQFLDTIENILKNSENRILKDLFAQESSVSIGGWNYMTGILWSLETLAWHQDYLTRVSVILGKLAEIDPDGNWTNRPMNSLVEIFLPWFPQTIAPIAIRKVAINSLLKECPEVTWKLLLKLLPHHHQVSTGSRKPKWREFIPRNYAPKFNKKDYNEQIISYSNLAAQLATTDLNKLEEIVKNLEDLPLVAFDVIIDYFSLTDIQKHTEESKAALWDILLGIVIKHKKFAYANWVMPRNSIERISILVEKLRPSSPLLLYKRLFRHDDFEIEELGNYDEQMQNLNARRVNAVQEILKFSGINGLLTFVNSVSDTLQVGIALGKISTDENEKSIFPTLLHEGPRPIRDFTSGYIWSRFKKNSWSWVHQLNLINWSKEELSIFLTFLPFERTTWSLVKSLLAEDEYLYWKQVDAIPFELEKEVLTEAVAVLLKFNRPKAAIKCLNWMINEKMEINVDFVQRALLDNLKSEGEPYQISLYSCGNLIKWLQNNSDPENEYLVLIEWNYLSMLDENSGLAPISLELNLAKHPAFFWNIFKLVFASSKEKEKEQEQESSKEKAQIAINAFHLLNNWKRPPGFLKDEQFDGKILNTWLIEAKNLYNDYGHLQVAMQLIGQVLVHSPSDPDGLWIHRAVAEILNQDENDFIRQGFSMGLYNKRGVYLGTAGEEERELANDYRQKALILEIEGYFRLATEVRNIATSYDKQAVQEATENPFEF